MLTFPAEAADFQLVMGGFEVLADCHLRNFFFYGRIFCQNYYLTALQAGEVVMMVLKDVAQFQLGVPAQLQAAYNAKLFKNFDVSIHGCLVMSGE